MSCERAGQNHIGQEKCTSETHPSRKAEGKCILAGIHGCNHTRSPERPLAIDAKHTSQHQHGPTYEGED
jgi:hypothetical protein